MAELDRYLEDLESRIDDEAETQLRDEWVAFTEGRFHGDIFSPRRTRKAPPKVDWPEVRVNETLDDFDRMALQQFRDCSAALRDGSGKFLAVRSNYGTSIIPSLFGPRLFIMPDETDTLPTSWPLTVGQIEKAVAAGVPDLGRGFAPRVLEMGRRFVDIKRKYPRIGRHVYVYHPDFQGPTDICEVLWGSGIFLDLVDRPALVHAFLDIITETYIRFMRAWAEVVPFSPDGMEVHWGMLHRGHVMLRDDSAMNLPPAMYEEFVLPHDQTLLDEFGGGAIHFCGRGDHFIARMAQMPGLHAIAMSQPECNDMELVYRSTVDRGIPLIGFGADAAKHVRTHLAAGRNLHGRVHCW